jgi:hypothetical protein
MTSNKRDRSLTTTLLLITTAQIALPTTIVTLLTTPNSQRDIAHLAGQIMESLSLQTENQIQYQLKTPQLINRSNAQNQRLSSEQRRDRLRHLTQTLQTQNPNSLPTSS